MATVCSIVVNGVLLKNGIPMDSKFGGILQIRNGRPLRFVELIYYSGSSLDPSEVFIRGKMTSVRSVVDEGEGMILANFREDAPDNLRLFAFGVGYDVDTYLLDSIAQENHGASAYVLPGENLVERVAAFYSKMNSPVLIGLSPSALSRRIRKDGVGPKPEGPEGGTRP